MEESCLNCIYQEEYLIPQENEYGDQYEEPIICCSNSESDRYGMEISSSGICSQYEKDIFNQDDNEDLDLEDIKKELIERWGEDEEELEENTQEEIMDKYKEMQEEFNDDSSLFPNGRDYDAEDEDGI